jgi:hypothetical protein
MHSEHYPHPEFGWLSPTARLRRELRTAFFSALFGIGIGAAAMVALNGNGSTDDAPVSRGVNAGAVAAIMEEPPDGVPGNNSLQAGRVEDEVNRGQTSKPDGSSAGANSKNRKTNTITTCGGNKAACLKMPLPAARPRGMRVPANDALAIARVPLGRSDASAGMTSAAPSASSERVPEPSTAGPSQQPNAEDAAADRPDSNRLSHKEPDTTARSQNRQRREAANHREDRAAYSIGRGYDRLVGQAGRAYANDRSYAQKGFWDWSD